jgi:anti-sigma regulatory factor (Ser/Thr protein kinase)
MRDISLHILDIAENSINAEAKNIEINIIEDTSKDLLTVEVADDGKGIKSEMKEKVTDPFVTSRTTRNIGLGIPLLKAAAEAANGKLTIKSGAGKGTRVTATFQLNHIDRKPLGNLKETLKILIVSNPELNIKYVHKKDNQLSVIDTKELKDEFSQSEIQTYEFIKYLGQKLNEIN